MIHVSSLNMRVVNLGIAVLGISPSTSAAALNGPCFQFLASKLSESSETHFPGSVQFDSLSRRWSNLKKPNIQVAVVAATEEDVEGRSSSPSNLTRRS
jgi:hypothetical protein